MEGVVIRAKKGIVTVSVVSNAKGEFSFPAAKLEPGSYALSIRATGYDLTGPSTVTLAGAPLNVDLKLTKTKNIAAQLTNLEWILSVPGTERQKNILSRCVNCHTLERVIDNKHDAAAWKDVIAPDGDLFQQQLPSEAAGAQGSARHGSFRPQYR